MADPAAAPPAVRYKGSLKGDPYKRYQKMDRIGHGACKTVYKAFDEEEGIEVAWNEVHCSDSFFAFNGGTCAASGASAAPADGSSYAGKVARLSSEINLLRQLKHKNILRLYEWWYDPREQLLVFITELLTDGSLRHYVHRHKRRLNDTVIKRYAWQILQGLVYLHGHFPPIIHRDLKCDNILVNGASGDIKIGDLGFATLLRSTATRLSVIGTPEFMAPELYDEQYDEKVDVYSLGMCVLEMAAREYPYSECSNVAQIYRKVSQGIPPVALAKVLDPGTRSFISTCITPDPRQRPEARRLLNHPFFDAVRPRSAGAAAAAAAAVAAATLPAAHAMAAAAGGGVSAKAQGLSAPAACVVAAPHSTSPQQLRACVSVDAPGRAANTDVGGGTGAAAPAPARLSSGFTPRLAAVRSLHSSGDMREEDVLFQDVFNTLDQGGSGGGGGTASWESDDGGSTSGGSMRRGASLPRAPGGPGARAGSGTGSGSGGGNVLSGRVSTPRLGSQRRSVSGDWGGRSVSGGSGTYSGGGGGDGATDDGFVASDDGDSSTGRVGCAWRHLTENQLSFNINLSWSGTRKRVGFNFDILSDTAEDIAAEMLQHLSLRPEQADLISSKIQEALRAAGLPPPEGSSGSDDDANCAHTQQHHQQQQEEGGFAAAALAPGTFGNGSDGAAGVAVPSEAAVGALEEGQFSGGPSMLQQLQPPLHSDSPLPPSSAAVAAAAQRRLLRQLSHSLQSIPYLVATGTLDAPCGAGGGGGVCGSSPHGSGSGSVGSLQPEQAALLRGVLEPVLELAAGAPCSERWGPCGAGGAGGGGLFGGDAGDDRCSGGNALPPESPGMAALAARQRRSRNGSIDGWPLDGLLPSANGSPACPPVAVGHSPHALPSGPAASG